MGLKIIEKKTKELTSNKSTIGAGKLNFYYDVSFFEPLKRG